jgi:hypothetical protein
MVIDATTVAALVGQQDSSNFVLAALCKASNGRAQQDIHLTLALPRKA